MNNMVKVSTLLENDITPFMYGVLMGRTVVEGNMIIAYSASKSAITVDKKIEEFDCKFWENYCMKLNDFSGEYKIWNTKNNLNFKFKQRGNAFWIIENDLKLTSEDFYRLLYRKLLNECNWMFDDNLNEESRDYIRGFMELRGSIDYTANFMTQDIFYNTKFELNKARIFIDNFNINPVLVNFNFRELQNQYVTGESKRNAQFRIRLLWYMENIGIISDYKAYIFEQLCKINYKYSEKSGVKYYNTNSSNLKNNKVDSFTSKLNFYGNNIFDQDLNESQISEIRTTLDLDFMKHEKGRNRLIVESVRLLRDDICDCCGNEYDIKDRTFIHKRTGRPYFEIHHMISLGNNHKLDTEDNLSKLCPICHTALKKGYSDDEYQIDLIKKILKNNEKVSYFCKSYMDIEELDPLADEIQKNLL